MHSLDYTDSWGIASKLLLPFLTCSTIVNRGTSCMQCRDCISSIGTKRIHLVSSAFLAIWRGHDCSDKLSRTCTILERNTCRYPPRASYSTTTSGHARTCRSYHGYTQSWWTSGKCPILFVSFPTSSDCGWICISFCMGMFLLWRVCCK